MPLHERKADVHGSGADLFTGAFRRRGGDPKQGEVFRREEVSIHFDRAEELYQQWPKPVCILSDGPYGVNGFPGDEQKWATLA